MEYALECLRRAQNYPKDSVSELLVYERFLDELETCVARVPKAYLPTYSELYSTDQSLARFNDTATAAARQITSWKSVLKGIPVLGPILVFTWRNVLLIKSRIGQMMHSPALNADSEVEQLLHRHSLDSQADLLKKNRLAQAPAGRLAASGAV